MKLPFPKAVIVALGVLTLPMALPGFVLPAAAQIESREGIALRDEILQLRQEVDALRAQVNEQGGASFAGGRPSANENAGASDMVPRLLERVNTLEDEIRTLRGRVDELQNEQQQRAADLNKKIGDLQFQMQNPGAATPDGTAAAGTPTGASGAAPAAPSGLAPSGPAPTSLAPPPPYAPAKPPPPPPPSPAAAAPSKNPLQAGYAALARRDYPAAERNARAVLSRRAAPGAYDAQFLLAEALAGQHQWSRAAIAYDDAYSRSKRGAHAPAALLGLAQSLTAIREQRAACETLAKLHAEFPREGTALRTQAAETARLAHCR